MDFNIRSELVIYRGGSIPKTMINDIRVSQLVISKTLSVSRRGKINKFSPPHNWDT